MNYNISELDTLNLNVLFRKFCALLDCSPTNLSKIEGNRLFNAIQTEPKTAEGREGGTSAPQPAASSPTRPAQDPHHPISGAARQALPGAMAPQGRALRLAARGHAGTGSCSERPAASRAPPPLFLPAASWLRRPPPPLRPPPPPPSRPAAVDRRRGDDVIATRRRRDDVTDGLPPDARREARRRPRGAGRDVMQSRGESGDSPRLGAGKASPVGLATAAQPGGPAASRAAAQGPAPSRLPRTRLQSPPPLR